MNSQRVSLVLVAMVLIGATACTSSPQVSMPPDTSAGVWSVRAPLPTARQEMPSAHVNGRIYTPGGYDAPGGTVAILEIYDVASDSWSTGPSMPAPRNHPGVAAANGIVYVTGGYTPLSGSASTFAFDPATQSWSTKRQMLSPRAAHVSVEYNGKIYVIGGVGSAGAVTSNEVYDPAADTWTELAPMPTRREHLTAAVIGDRILVVGRTRRWQQRNSRGVFPRQQHLGAIAGHAYCSRRTRGGSCGWTAVRVWR